MTMIRRSINALGIALVLGGSTAYAHQGHGHTPGDTPLHYVIEPMHSIPIALAVLILVAFAWWGNRKVRPATRS